MKMLKIKTNIFVIFLISIILLIAQPSNCFAPYQSLEAHVLFNSDEEDFETQYFGALLPLPFESIQTATDTPELMHAQKTLRPAAPIPLPVKKFREILPRIGSATQQPSAAAVTATSSLMISRSRKRSRVEATYTCSYPGCTNSYVTKGGLNKHDIRAHRKKTPHKCPSCTNAYAYKCELNQHISAIHKKERPHECYLCPSAYAYRSGLTEHVIAAHIKEKPHKCPNCTNAYALRRDLILHINTAHTPKNQIYPCEEPGCPNVYALRGSLVRHIIAIHGIEKTCEHEPFMPYASEQTLATSSDLIDSNNHVLGVEDINDLDFESSFIDLCELQNFFSEEGHEAQRLSILSPHESIQNNTDTRRG